MHKLMTIGIDGSDMVAQSPVSGIELARNYVFGEDTQSHIEAAQGLVIMAFESLNAEGFQRATPQ
jgi:hypothetical protein